MSYAHVMAMLTTSLFMPPHSGHDFWTKVEKRTSLHHGAEICTRSIGERVLPSRIQEPSSTQASTGKQGGAMMPLSFASIYFSVDPHLQNEDAGIVVGCDHESC
jgi:hypothetical protein